MTSSVRGGSLTGSGLISAPGSSVVRKGASISVLVYVLSLTRTSAFMCSVGLVRSSLGVALLRKDEEAAYGEYMGVEPTPAPAAVAVLVLIAALAHLLPEAQRGAELLEDHADADPGGVVVQLGDGQAATESLDILQLLVGGRGSGGGSRSCVAPGGARRWCDRRGRGIALDHLEELVGEPWDVFEPLHRTFGPRVFAVALYLARGAVAQAALELDVHVVFDALVCNRRARGAMLFLLRVDVEDVVISAGGGRLFRGVVLVHVQLIDEIEAALGGLVGLVVEVQQDRPTTRPELATH